VAAFLDMGGYAVFVWPAYGVAVVVLAGLALASLRRLRRCQRGITDLNDEKGGGRR